MEQQSDTFLNNASAALKNIEHAERRDRLAILGPQLRTAAIDRLESFGNLRLHMKKVRQHALDNLDYYLTQFEKEAVHNGNQVHFARDDDELNSIVLDICQQHDARRITKGKSMVTAETGLNSFLQSAGLNVVETDLGEYIIQQAGETSTHIVAPALHKSADEVRELFQQKHDLGPRELPATSDLVAEARHVLRQHFLQAEVGIIGSNALISENGYSMLATSDGNGDLSANLPKVLIICATIDQIIPRAEDASAIAQLLACSGTGQSQACYTSFYSGPRREGDLDGPLETHFVLLDNERSNIMASDYREILECINCGACLNHCPVYANIGGHAYGSVYTGPIGSVLTPLLTSLEQSHLLPNACTSCGRCAEVCPADIPLPDLLRDLRHEEIIHKLAVPRWRYGLKLHAWLARHPAIYQTLSATGISILHRLGRKKGRFSTLPFASGWTSQRDFPAPQTNTFMHLYKSRMKPNNER